MSDKPSLIELSLDDDGKPEFRFAVWRNGAPVFAETFVRLWADKSGAYMRARRGDWEETMRMGDSSSAVTAPGPKLLYLLMATEIARSLAETGMAERMATIFLAIEAGEPVPEWVNEGLS